MSTQCPFLLLLISLGFEVYFVRYQNDYAALHLKSISLEYLFLSFDLELMSGLDGEQFFFDAIEEKILFSHPVFQSLLLGG